MSTRLSALKSPYACGTHWILLNRSLPIGENVSLVEMQKFVRLKMMAKFRPKLDLFILMLFSNANYKYIAICCCVDYKLRLSFAFYII
ncbi:hypothetical protein BpHYR1_025938 [Brachionus plicatilis]|uniref:Uncharacterized protein n=1 Tax=Brachionus plicatilis TaxID=10195 RepID=A0A3M7SM25_BRAPC|nr:hypothetical protein BpHYR1_025938 [Brachionus plicatilis]